MLNLVTIEGFVTSRRWRRDGYHFFRIACYRDPDRPRKHQDAGPGRWDRPDYVSVKIPPGLTTMAMSIRPNQRVRIVGWLESEDYMESLARFLQRAEVTIPEELRDQADQIAVSRAATWIVADRIVIVFPEEDRESTLTEPEIEFCSA